MTSINRFSSRRQRLDHSFLCQRLKNARSYKRIAGYFRSSIFELIDEEIAGIPDVRIVCNSDLDFQDIAVSKAVREASLKEKWNEVLVEVEALLQRERYQKLFDLLSRGNVQIRVVPKDKIFLHGKAGVIETENGKICFIGSINETKSAFAQNYEILWEDPSPEGVAWVEEEFEALWKEAFDLPEAIVYEIKRIAHRQEVRLEEVPAKELPEAALVESPIYRGGEQLQPWQRSFVTTFLAHRETYGSARLLLADEVGLGKTLSLGTSAMLSALLGDGPVLILCPSTLTLQWQVELKDRLGIPSAVWLSQRKMWQDPNGHIIRTRGSEDIVRCPFQIAIVSVGLIIHNTSEKAELLKCRFGTVILDEAHKARRKSTLGQTKGDPNNLLSFMEQIGSRTKNLLLGTATPIQTEVQEIWDLMGILNAGKEFVLGKMSEWEDRERVLPYIKGESGPRDEREAWDLLRNPLPPSPENPLFFSLRMTLEIEDKKFFSNLPLSDLGWSAQEEIRQTLDGSFFKDNNPLVRHTVLRRREFLEEKGFLEKIEVSIHPDSKLGNGAYPGQNFAGLGLLTNHFFDQAYQAAEAFTKALGERVRGTGFMKSLLLQRICSSFASGKATAERMLKRERLDEEEEWEEVDESLKALTQQEAAFLETIRDELSRPEARDPKLSAVQYFLTEHKTEGKTWLEHGSIIFSQYYDTAFWIAQELAKILKGEVAAVYAGIGKSGLFRGEEFGAVEREEIKRAVKNREIRLVVATDAACEGLNLQTLGTLINVDLPWNPSRLEQRLGRIKRFGQVRKTVDMANLVYHDTQDERIYQVLSQRLKDKFDLFGGLPDTIEDDWIENVEQFEELVDRYIHLRKQAQNAFDLRYQKDVNPDLNRWELCSRVLARTDIVDRLSEPW